MKYFVALAAALVLNATANLLMKVGANSLAAKGGLLSGGPVGAVKTIATNLPLGIGLTCFALNVVLYMYALQSPTLKISIAYPIMVGGGFGLIAVVARFHPALAENLTTGQWVGVGFVLVGILLIAAQMKPELS